MTGQILTVDIRSYWHPGGGHGQGALLDAAVHCDANGLPVLPGRHLKGLIREALEMAEQWGWQGYQGLSEVLFGKRTETNTESTAPAPGCLRISSATLPLDVVRYLQSKDGKELTPGLFRAIYATAIDYDSGTAKNESLRGLEIVIPLRLEASITPIAQAPEDWAQRISAVLPLISSVGAHRNRGLGRSVLSLGDMQ